MTSLYADARLIRPNLYAKVAWRSSSAGFEVLLPFRNDLAASLDSLSGAELSGGGKLFKWPYARSLIFELA